MEKQLEITTTSMEILENSNSLYERQYIYKHPSRHEVMIANMSLDDREENGKYITGRLGLGQETIYWLQLNSFDSPERVAEVINELNDLKQIFDLFYDTSINAINTVNQTTETK